MGVYSTIELGIIAALTTREHAGFKHAQEETGGQQATVVLNEALHHRGKTKEKHVDGEPDVGLELFEENVGGDLEEAVWNEEDDKGGIVLCRRVVDFAVMAYVKLEIFGQAENVGIGNVDTIYSKKKS